MTWVDLSQLEICSVVQSVAVVQYVLAAAAV